MLVFISENVISYITIYIYSPLLVDSETSTLFTVSKYIGNITTQFQWKTDISSLVFMETFSIIFKHNKRLIFLITLFREKNSIVDISI